MTINSAGRTTPLIARLIGDDATRWDQLLSEAEKSIEEANAREAASARQALASAFDRLPKSHSPLTKDPFRTLADLGFQVGDPLDDLFIQVTPPPGWSLKADPDGEQWEIFDGMGRARGAIYLTEYPNEFSAFFSLRTRFDIHILGFQSDGSRAVDVQATYVQSHVEDALKAGPLFTSKEHPIEASDDDLENIVAGMASHQAAKSECEDWLAANFPDWRNPAAYWD